MGFCFKTIILVIVKNNDNIKCWRDMGKWEFSYTAFDSVQQSWRWKWQWPIKFDIHTLQTSNSNKDVDHSFFKRMCVRLGPLLSCITPLPALIKGAPLWWKQSHVCTVWQALQKWINYWTVCSSPFAVPENWKQRKHHQ